MTYPIDTEVRFECRVPNRETGGETPLWIMATVTDHGEVNDLPFGGRYTTKLKFVYRGAVDELPMLDMLHNAGYDPKPIEDIVEACERRAFDQLEAMRAHVDRRVPMPAIVAWALSDDKAPYDPTQPQKYKQ